MGVPLFHCERSGAVLNAHGNRWTKFGNLKRLTFIRNPASERMQSSCLKHSHIPGTSRIFTDYLYHFDRVAKFYSEDPFDPSSYKRTIEQIQFPAERRRALVEALARQNPSSSSLDVLAHPGSIAVVTGQQVGLFGGPAYTIFKALTAVRLASRLSDEGSPAVPVFWLATEDHDLAEVDHAWVFNENSVPARVSADIKASAGPVGRSVLSDVPIAELKRGLGDLPFAAEVLAMVEQAYRPGRTLGAAFRDLLTELLRGMGILFLDPLKPEIRKLAAPFLSDAALRAGCLVEKLQARSKELEKAGYHAQVNIESTTSPVFLLDQSRRVTLKLRDGRFITKERTYSASELQSRATDISPNALLRPVMQDYILPTVAYVGGPAEVAYMAQAQVVYDELLGRMPVIVPRNGFTLLDERTWKLIHHYDFQVHELLDHEERVRSRMADRLVPPELREDLNGARAAAQATLSDLKSKLSAFDPTLAAAAQKSGGKILYQFEKLARKAANETMRRNTKASADAEYLSNLVYPHRHLQERFFSILPFLAKHGTDVIHTLLENTQLDCPDHMVRVV